MNAKLFFAVYSAAFIVACTTVHQPVPTLQSAPPATASIPRTPITVRVAGHGTVRPDSGYTVSQMKLMAQRAARLDAYRLLTEHIYGLKLFGTTSVSAMVVQNDAIRSYVSGFIRGAREISTTRMDDDFTYETVLEIKLDYDFFKYCYNLYHAQTPYCVDSLSTGCTSQDRYFYISR
jgi:hypothetical protein